MIFFSPTTRRSARRTIPAVIILILLSILVYANTFNAPFLYDDLLNITQNRHIRLTAVTVDDMSEVFNSPSGNRPLANLTMALNYYFGRYDVRGFHAVNLFIHICTALLIFLVARQTLKLCGTDDNTLAAFLAAALWLVSPVHTQSVTYTIQRMNAMAAMFYMLTLFCYIRARIQTITGHGPVQRRLLYAFCLISGLLGMASKEITATLPVMIFLYEWYFFRNLDRAWLKRQLPWITLSAVIIIILAGLYLGTSPMEKILRSYQKDDFTMPQRLLTEPGVVIYYLCLLLFPFPGRLMLLYDFPVSLSPVTSAVTALSLLAIGALLAAALWRPARHRLLSFAVLWFLGNLVIESSVFGLALIFEHRAYLPSVFPFIALSALAMKKPRTRPLAATILCVLVIVCGLCTFQRNAVWNDAVRFWQDNAAKAPNVPQIKNNLGQALLSRDKYVQAADCFKDVIKQKAGFEAAHVNLGVALQRRGQLAPAITEYQTALVINPGNIDARFNLAMLFKEHGQTTAAISQLEKIIAINPESTGAMLNLGAVLMELKQNEKALFWLKKAAALDPSDVRILNNLGIVLHRLGRTEEAIGVYRQGLMSAPENPILHNSLGLALMDCHRYGAATRQFQLALAADPSLIEAYNNLGLTAERQGETDRAINYYRRALNLSPAYTLARYNLAALFLESGQPEKAITLLRIPADVKKENWPALTRLFIALANMNQLRQATELAEKMATASPDDAAIYYNLACLYARQKDRERAVSALKKAVDRGYDRWHYIKVDPDLKNIHDMDDYKTLMRDHGY